MRTDKEMTMNENFVNKRIKTLIEKKGWSVYKLAQESGLPPSTLYNMFERDTIPGIATLVEITKGMDMTLSQFFAEEGFPDLTSRQKMLLERFDALSEEKKLRLEAYMEGMLFG